MPASLIQWLLSDCNKSLVLVGSDNDILQALEIIKKQKKIVVQSKFTIKSKQKIVENLYHGFSNVFYTSDLDEFVRIYLRSITRERESQGLQNLTPVQIYDICSSLHVVDLDPIKDDSPDLGSSEYLAELFSLYSTPELFINDLITRVHKGEVTKYLNTFDSSNYANRYCTVFKLRNTGNIYINIKNLLKYWKKIFGYELQFEPIEIKRYIWGISKERCLLVSNEAAKYREINGQ